MGKASRRKRARSAEGAPGVSVRKATGGTPPKGARREGPQAPEAGASPGGAGGVLGAIQGAAAERDAADQRLVDAVEAARAAGESWHAIGGALGLTSEGARQRYSVRKAAAPLL